MSEGAARSRHEGGQQKLVLMRTGEDEGYLDGLRGLRPQIAAVQFPVRLTAPNCHCAHTYASDPTPASATESGPPIVWLTAHLSVHVYVCVHTGTTS